MQATVSKWMSTNPITITPDTLCSDAYRLMIANDIRHLPVVADEKLLGVVLKTDIRQITLLGAHEAGNSAETVAHIITDLPTIGADATMLEATLLLLREKLSALPVVDESQRLIGILTESDLLYHAVQQSQPIPEPKTVTVKDGKEVIIRPISPRDAPNLRKLYANLSQRSLFYRFLEAHNPITSKHLRQFSITDYSSQMAFVAVDPSDNRLIGISQYLPLEPHQPDKGEFAISIADDWQRQGVGHVLMRELTDYARERGMKALLGVIHYDNRGMMKLIRRLGYRLERHIDHGVYEVWIKLQERED